MINVREGWRGHLWQGRFASFPLDEQHLFAAVRYIERNPVQAHLASEPEAWPWSSARAHLSGVDDELVTVLPLLAMVGEWRSFLSSSAGDEAVVAIRKHERTGRPLGNEIFVEKLELITNRALKRRKPGPKGPRQPKAPPGLHGIP
jgi:putative transposase